MGRLPEVAAERARFELANRVRRLRHFQSRHRKRPLLTVQPEQNAPEVAFY